jgi:hypothetical protein
MDASKAKKEAPEYPIATMIVAVMNLIHIANSL